MELSIVINFLDYIFALPFTDDLVAQLVEHLPFKERVLGSSPSQVTSPSNFEGLFFIQLFHVFSFLFYDYT